MIAPSTSAAAKAGMTVPVRPAGRGYRPIAAPGAVPVRAVADKLEHGRD